MSVTFDVSPEVRLGKPLTPIDLREALKTSMRRDVEAHWQPRGSLVEFSETHAFLAALETAFYRHYPLILSPDAVWLTLARGFALHVNLHAEELRTRFVRHQGQLKLVVIRSDFFPGRDNPWPEAFATFSDLIRDHVGKLRDFVQCDFSTTGPESEPRQN